MNSTNVFIKYTFLEGKSTMIMLSMIIKITLKLFLV